MNQNIIVLFLKSMARQEAFAEIANNLFVLPCPFPLPLSALSGLLISPLPGHLLKLGLSIAGFFVCLIFLNTIYREKAYYQYQYYLNRAKEIVKLFAHDSKQIMSLYTSGADATNKSITKSNKNALAVVLWIALACFIGSIVYFSLTGSQQPQVSTSVTNYVPDEGTAIKIAIAIWTPLYGKKQIEKEKPYRAVLKEGIWYVSGSLSKGWLGGVASAEIGKMDGKILGISHGQ